MINPFKNLLRSKEAQRWWQSLTNQKQNELQHNFRDVLLKNGIPFPSYPEWLGDHPSSALAVSQWLTAKKEHNKKTSGV